MVDSSKPFWEQEFTALDQALDPFGHVESKILLTPQEIANLKNNLNSTSTVIDSRFLTIYKVDDIPYEHLQNGQKFIPKLKELEQDYIASGGCALIWTSLYRSIPHHLRVYAAKGITDRSKIPMGSSHLVFLAGDAVPVKMPVAHFHAFLIKDNEAVLKKYKFYMEHESHTLTWGHVQDRPYPSWRPGMSHRYHIKK